LDCIKNQTRCQWELGRDGTSKATGLIALEVLIFVFPNCFLIPLGKTKFPLIFVGKCYILLPDIFNKYLLSFSGLHFSSCLLHTQEVTGSNPVAPTTLESGEYKRGQAVFQNIACPLLLVSCLNDGKKMNCGSENNVL